MSVLEVALGVVPGICFVAALLPLGVLIARAMRRPWSAFLLLSLVCIAVTAVWG